MPIRAIARLLGEITKQQMLNANRHSETAARIGTLISAKWTEGKAVAESKTFLPFDPDRIEKVLNTDETELLVRSLIESRRIPLWVAAALTNTLDKRASK